MKCERRRGEHERGSAPADFVFVGSLLTAFALAIVQLTLVMHVRNILIDAAASAARYGSLADRTREDARTRAAELVGTAVGGSYASDISVGDSVSHGIRVLEVRIKAPLPLVGLVGPERALEVVGHAPLQ
jgi:Flp pilus assembly protein TadG